MVVVEDCSLPYVFLSYHFGNCAESRIRVLSPPLSLSLSLSISSITTRRYHVSISRGGGWSWWSGGGWIIILLSNEHATLRRAGQDLGEGPTRVPTSIDDNGRKGLITHLTHQDLARLPRETLLGLTKKCLSAMIGCFHAPSCQVSFNNWFSLSVREGLSATRARIWGKSALPPPLLVISPSLSLSLSPEPHTLAYPRSFSFLPLHSHPSTFFFFFFNTTPPPPPSPLDRGRHSLVIDSIFPLVCELVSPTSVVLTLPLAVNQPATTISPGQLALF